MKAFILITVLSLAAAPLGALDFWLYPEAADKSALFVDGMAASLSFSDGFHVFLPEFHIDYLIPLGLPFSLGLFFQTPDPNLKSFGLRAGYHINLNKENVDLYALYVFDFGFTRNGELEKYGDEKQEPRYYDFRAGLRNRFGRFVCLCVETGFKLQSFYVGLSIKLN
jgi:hypothetical protein